MGDQKHILFMMSRRSGRQCPNDWCKRPRAEPPASLYYGCRPRLPVGGGTQTMSESNQIVIRKVTRGMLFETGGDRG